MTGESLAAPLAATSLLLVLLAVFDRRMQASGGPGIIPFELAGPTRSEAILHAWGNEGQRAARASLMLDFPFLLAYTTLNVQLTRRASASASGDGAFGLLAQVVMAIQVAAGACDGIENTALLIIVTRGGDHRLASIAQTAARAKFAGLITGWLYGAAVVCKRRFT